MNLSKHQRWYLKYIYAWGNATGSLYEWDDFVTLEKYGLIKNVRKNNNVIPVLVGSVSFEHTIKGNWHWFRNKNEYQR